MTYESNGRTKSRRGKAKKLGVKMSSAKNLTGYCRAPNPTLRGENPGCWKAKGIR
jgi:hypothetical protein